jgi:hypothetical protein
VTTEKFLELEKARETGATALQHVKHGNSNVNAVTLAGNRTIGHGMASFHSEESEEGLIESSDETNNAVHQSPTRSFDSATIDKAMGFWFSFEYADRERVCFCGPREGGSD